MHGATEIVTSTSSGPSACRGWCRIGTLPSMTSRISVDASALGTICRARGVARLRIFGSALSDRFDDGRSDVDLLVEFVPGSADPFDAYFGLREDLESLFGRPVDLVMASAVRNPYFAASADAVAEGLYAA
ncbi:nucleotidyltransferase family protein [Plantibacter sp. CFBP 8804]|uniref:nucleotidyltransferase family protein n=2 Tax=unclassified Plantibacter TaxID=2624265 RepID=UPI00352F4F59